MWGVALSAAVGLLTALSVLARARDSGESNWPVNWELRSSDNGVLFQVLQDLAAGRTLDWSFSPQVYVFPELPVSALAFALSGADLYWYYLWVAVINNVILALCLMALSSVILPHHRSARWALRAGIASTPLIALPLIGTTWLFSFHLAPTYYFGMYAAVLIAPVVLLARRRWVRVAVGLALALTVASNPLAVLFAVPGALVVVVLLFVRRRWSALRSTIAGLGAVVFVALVVRFTAFAPLQGTSPLTYVDPDIFAGRLAGVDQYFRAVTSEVSVHAVLVSGAMLAILCLIAAVVCVILWVRGAKPASGLLAACYLGLIPLGGIGATYLMMITHHYYFWFTLIAPFVLVMLALPNRWLPAGALGATAALVAIALATGSFSPPSGGERFFGYRNSETACLDAALPPGPQVGYATFSDSRRLALTSDHPFRLIPILPSGEPNFWLANRATVREQAGSFFYINEGGDELPIDVAALRDRFGQPDREISCADGQTIMLYTDEASLARIGEFYDVRGQ